MLNSRGLVRFGDSTIKYEVRRSARRKKTVQITVDARYGPLCVSGRLGFSTTPT